jgi:fimbrial chaperone protein
MPGNTTGCDFSWRAYLIGTLLLAALVAIAPASRAADFSVSPMRLEMDRGARSGQIQVRNLDQQPVRFQVGGADWSQDENGNNIYADSQSLIWFPRALELGPGESRIIRVGVRATPASRELAYVVTLREVALDAPRAEQPRGAQVRVLLNVSVPVFVLPAKPTPGGAIESLSLRGGKLDIVVANGGNRHLRYREAAIVGLGSDGAEKFARKLPGKTLLAGSRQRFEEKIPRAACRQLREIVVTLAAADTPEIRRRLDVSRADCE